MKTRDRLLLGVFSVLVLLVGNDAIMDHRAQSNTQGTSSPPRNDQVASTLAAQNPRMHARAARHAELQMRFAQATAMLHAKQYEHAIAALHRVLELAPRMPEAHVNMGYALLGLRRYQPAQDFFVSALALRPAQTNAYFGLAVAKEGLSDLPGALGAMRTYIHLAPKEDTYARRARAAIWEWEQARTGGTIGNAVARVP